MQSRRMLKVETSASDRLRTEKTGKRHAWEVENASPCCLSDRDIWSYCSFRCRRSWLTRTMCLSLSKTSRSAPKAAKLTLSQKHREEANQGGCFLFTGSKKMPLGPATKAYGAKRAATEKKVRWVKSTSKTKWESRRIRSWVKMRRAGLIIFSILDRGE